MGLDEELRQEAEHSNYGASHADSAFHDVSGVSRSCCMLREVVLIGSRELRVERYRE